MAEQAYTTIFPSLSDSSWLLEIDGHDPALEPTIEAVCALVNGYGGTRAAIEEGSAISRPATFIAGIFNTPAQPQTPELDEPIPEIVVAPNWSRLRIAVEGQSLSLDQAELLEQRRVLDLRQGFLLREWRVRDSAGRITRLRSLRFASLDERHALVQLLTLTPENYSGRITLESLLDGRVTNENNTIHLAPVEARALEALTPNPSPAAAGEGSESVSPAEREGSALLSPPLPSQRERAAGGEGQLLTIRTLQSDYVLSFAAHADLRDASGTVITGTIVLEEYTVGQRWEWQAEQGQTYDLHKLVAVVTSRDTAQPNVAAPIVLARLRAAGAAALFGAHTRAWAARWATADAEIAGDLHIQRQVRFALYHLIGAAHPDERASIGARALTGERYRGHVFWDTETFIWPFYLSTHPATARALLLYRYNTLAGARNKAQSLGYRGALFAWESTDTGEETTPPVINVPGIGRQPILTGIEEHHLAADIAYAIVQYRQATADDVFFLDYGAEMLLEIGRFWSSRAVLGDDQRYHIRKVIGPDEYHESVDDNAYTNVMAQWTLRRALAAAAELEESYWERWRALAERLNLAQPELDAWRQVADGLVTGYDPDTGLFEQFAGYYNLRQVDLTGHDMADQTMDVKLGWEALGKTQVLKQADVVMLMFLQWDSYSPAARAANFRFYEPRTSHDSSLSASFHALVAARLGDLTMAERYLQQALRIDLDFTRKGWAGATGGVHIAALGGIWQALAYGFLGMRAQDQGLRFEPQIPAHWGQLRIPIKWRGSQLRVIARPDRAEITVESGAPVALAFGDGAWQLVSAGETLRGP
jgi:trehalose/maltose hydrolase-like predicted phosphorylase